MTDVMAECYRVLKPGAHGLVWAIPRTSHWTATALENAGFEVRDVVTHLFGSGFPKSLNVSKAIDKAAGAERETVGVNPSSRPNSKVKNGRGFDGMRTETESAGVQLITAPATEAAKQWDGWGTALKPASEHWILVRKPLSEKTVAANVLKWGTGAINIDGCRVAGKLDGDPNRFTKAYSQGDGHEGWRRQAHENYTPPVVRSEGRFPANLVLSHTIFCGDECSDDCPVRLLDEQSGGASRFFYVAKASKKDRGEGNTHPTVKPRKLMQYLAKMITPDWGEILDPFMGSGSTGLAAYSLDFGFTGIESDEKYFKIAKKRLAFSRFP